MSLFLALPAAASSRPRAMRKPPADVQQPPPVAAQDHPVMALIGSSVTWDSNVFHLPDSVDPAGAAGEAHQVRSHQRHVCGAARRQAVRAATLSP